MKTAVIIQARMNSTRLPGKVLMDLAGKPVLQHVIERCRRANVDDVIVATCEPSFDICCLTNSLGHDTFVGSEDNVYKRVLDCAENFDVDIIVEITADCPLVDPEHINRALKYFNQTGYVSYVSNCMDEKLSWADGFDIQAYRTDKLASINPINTEHVGWNVYKDIRDDAYPELRYHINAQPRYQHRYWGLTLDEQKDYEVLKLIFEHFKHNTFSAEDVMEFLFRNPQILAINHNVKRKEPGDG